MTTRRTSARIAPQPNQPNLTKGQKTFNTLVKKIEASRIELAQWQSVVQTYQHKAATDFSPLLQTFRKLQGSMVLALDQALDRGGLNKTERQVVRDIVCGMAEQLVAESGDTALKAVYNKYSPVDYDTEAASAALSMKDELQEVFGVDLGDIGYAESPEDLTKQMKRACPFARSTANWSAPCILTVKAICKNARARPS